MKIKWFSLVRLTGLLLVLLYHFFQTRFPGGFIGVDVLFTFSGYLVTALFIDEYARTGHLDLLAFARRRLNRLFPPLVLMMLLVMPMTILVKSDFVAGIGQQLVAALGFMTNVYELLTGGNYETQFVPHLFLHTWSLAVEVHFYLFWGLVCWVLSRRGLRKGEYRGALFILSLGLFFLSFSSLFIRTFLTRDFSSLYFSSLSRGFAFFLGSLFATLTGIGYTADRFAKNAKRWSLGRTVLQMSGCIAMLGFLSALLEFNHKVTYLFGFVLASFFSCLLIYSTRVLHEQTKTIEEPVWLGQLSDLSYGVYLFHWPIYVILSQRLSQLVAVGLTVVLSLALAKLSVSFVEPLIAGKVVSLGGRQFSIAQQRQLFTIVAGSLLAVTIGISVTAPRIGSFEQNLLISSLHQANTNLHRTHQLTAGDATAISDVLIIGDSVTLRASQSLSNNLPSAQLDASVSRSFLDAQDIFQNHIKNQTLPKTVVIAVGVNSVYNYQADIDQFVLNLPVGHRLVLVTPYNVKDGRVPAVRDYELSLAEQYEYIAVADWYRVAMETPAIWEGTDGVHFSDANNQGAELYAKVIQEAVAQVATQPAKID